MKRIVIIFTLISIVTAMLLQILSCSENNPVSSNADVDVPEPIVITDLRVDAIDLNRITVSWTEPVNSDDTMRVLYYDLRCHPDSITDTNWFDAKVYPSNTLDWQIPDEPGQRKTCDIVGLQAGIKYCIALRVTDYYGRRNPISNVVTGEIQAVFSTPQQIYARGHAMSTADIDSDGDLDLVAVEGGDTGENIFVYHNDGLGHFSLVNSMKIGRDLGVIRTADFDNDGDIDLAVQRTTYGGGFLLMNGGSGLVLDSVSRWGFDRFTESMEIGDFNNDGNADIVVGSELIVIQGGVLQYGKVHVLINNGNAIFEEILVHQGGNPYGIGVLDVQKDGDQDLVVINRNSHISDLFCNSGDGKNWSYCNDININLSPWAITSTDLTNDGYSDLILVPYAGSHFYPILNEVGLSVQPAVYGINRGVPISTDFNHDNFNDIIVVHRDGGLSLCLNDGTGHFIGSTHYSFGNGGTNYNGVVGDFNGDGYDDVAVKQLLGDLYILFSTMGSI